MKTLKDISLLLRNGLSVNQSPDAGGLPISRIETIADGTIDPKRVGYAGLSRKNCDGWILQRGDLLISHINSTKHLGKCAVYIGEPPNLVHVMNLLGLRVNREVAFPEYVYRMMSSPTFRRQIPRITKHSVNQSSFNISSFKKLEIPLPPLAEQKRIAGILDAADALRAKRREALAQLDTLLQATFLDLFGDMAETVSIGDMLERDILLLHKDGNHGSLYPRADEFGETGIPFLSAKCISENGDLLRGEVQYLSESKARNLKFGWIKAVDVLLAHNASVGKTFGYRGEFDEALIGTSLTAFRANRKVLDPAYLLGALRTQDFQQQLFSNMGQTTRNQVPITAQRRLTLRLPPLEDQKRFATLVDAIEKQRKISAKHLAELDTLFAALQHRAFRGEL